jgi:prevent-host-death family protein
MYNMMYTTPGDALVRQTTFTEFRRHAKDFFDAVEAGDVVRVYRNGRPIADVVPIPSEEPAWKRPVARLTLRGARASDAVAQDRAGE